MKNLLLLVCLVMSFNLYGQRKNKRAAYFIKIQNGFLYDSHFNVDYTGFNLINVGWSKVKEGQLNAFNLEFIKYTSSFQKEPGPNSTAPKWRRKRKSLELEYYRSLLFTGANFNGLHLGPTASILYLKDKFDPTSSARVKFEEKCYCLGIGAKAVYSYGITKKIFLNLSTKLTLLDLGFYSKQEFSPWRPLRDQKTSDFKANLMRNQFALLFGLNFKL